MRLPLLYPLAYPFASGQLEAIQVFVLVFFFPFPSMRVIPIPSRPFSPLFHNVKLLRRHFHHPSLYSLSQLEAIQLSIVVFPLPSS